MKMGEEKPVGQRILLNNPPSTKANPYSGDRVLGCTGLAHVAGYLRSSADCEIAIVDSPLEGLDFERTLERIEDFRPDVIGFTAYTAQIKAAARMAKFARDRLPGVVTVIGGVHVTALPPGNPGRISRIRRGRLRRR